MHFAGTLILLYFIEMLPCMVSFSFVFMFSVTTGTRVLNVGVINIDLTVPNVSCTHVSCTPSACLPITVVSSLNTQAASRLYL